ncbi:MAG: ankyrin repeat domain-containing protein [Chitinophagaceae bacterium]|nr:ankyrin repeat domain-containing protein [Chitinophagaceae bacterium]
MSTIEENLEASRPSRDTKFIEKVQRLIRPDALNKDEPLFWSPGIGNDVWDLFCSAITGDLDTIRRLLEKDPSLLRCQYEYRTPMYFAVRENQLETAAFFLQQGANAHWGGGDDSLPEIARYRGYHEMQRLLEDTLARQHNVSQKGEVIAAAIKNHSLQIIQTLLDTDPQLLNAGDVHGNQPIHWAVMTREPAIIDELLARGADINARRIDGARPIQLCNGDYSYRGWRDVPQDHPFTPGQILTHLRKHGAYVDVSTAAYIGDLSRVQALVEEDPSLANKPGEYVTYYACSGAPLRNAAAGGHLDIVTYLLEKGADPNLPEEGIAPQGYALYSAVYNDHYDIAHLLLEKGAIPNPPVESSADALSIALRNDNKDMVNLLCSYGAARSMEILAHYGDTRTAAAIFAVDPSRTNDPQALASAAGQGNESFVRLLLHYQPRLAAQIGTAAATPELTRFLFSKGMDPNKQNWLRVTPLHRFAEKGDIINAGIFLDHGADIHARDEDICSTPLAWAVKYGKREMVEFLLQRGAQPQLPDDPSWATPMAWAVYKGDTDIIRLLEQKFPNGDAL